MGYINASTLAGFLPQAMKLTASSVPDLTTADLYCQMIAAELDSAALKGGWSTPIPTTATVAYAAMQLWNQYGAGWHVLEQMLGSGNETGGKTSRAVEYRNAYMRALAALETGSLQLPDAPTADDTERVLPVSNVTGSDPCCATGWSPQPITRCTRF